MILAGWGRRSSGRTAAQRDGARSAVRRAGRRFEPAYYFAVNRSKQSITVNLLARRTTVIRDRQRRGVLVENFPVRTLARHGLGAAVGQRTRSSSSRAPVSARPGPAQRKGYDTVFRRWAGS
jgi:crotonobetainyl-CoA:carnitine CoA-transferase CaiB-like acyl-CoA transferase